MEEGSAGTGGRRVPEGGNLCASCGAQVPEGASFCASCGAPVEAEPPAAAAPSEYCSACGAALPAGASFCGSCGAAVRTKGAVPLSVAARAPERRRVGFWQRAIALGLIDFVVLWYVFLILALYMVWAATDPFEILFLGEQEPFGYIVYGDCQASVIRPVCFLYSDWDSIDASNVMWRTFLIVWAVGLFAYWWIGNAGWRTMGKALTGVRVIRKDSGQPLGPWRGFLRTLGYILSLAPLGLGYLWAIWDKDKQTWHDKIAGSVVEPGEPAGGLVLLLWLVIGVVLWVGVMALGEALGSTLGYI